MRNFSSKKILPELFSETSDYNVPHYINIVDKKKNEFVTNFLPQTGGSWNKKTKNTTDDDINQLIAMLTSDSEDKNNFTANSTQTDILENRLKNMIQAGGSNKKHISQKGGSGANATEVKKACDILANAGYSFTIGNKNCEQYVEANSPTTSSISNIFTADKKTTSPKAPSTNLPVVLVSPTVKQDNNSVTSSVMPVKKEVLSPTSTSIAITSSAKPSNNQQLSPTSTSVAKNDGASLFDVAATFISKTAKNVSKMFKNESSVTSEGVTSSPSGTVVGSPSSVGVTSSPSGTVVNSITSSVKPNKSVPLVLSPTSTSVKPNQSVPIVVPYATAKQIGGAKKTKKSSKKQSKKLSKKSKSKKINKRTQNKK